MTPTDQFAYLLPTLSKLVDGIDPDQLGQPTPCAEFTVHDVLDHMIVKCAEIGALLRGDEPVPTAAPAVYGRVPAREFREALDDVLDAMHTDGAMERIVDTPLGSIDGESFALLVCFDGIVHGWDLATATGQEFLPDEVIVGDVSSFVQAALPDAARDGDTFADPTTPPPSAGELERLVAFSGREC
jgi:uncharacterized protein (TIGR03086 family)